MKALLLKDKQLVEYKEIPTPDCPEDGLLLKIDAVGLCGSDVRTYMHGHSKITYPVILGHENVGTIVEVGNNVKGYEKGEKILASPAISCGKCYYCTHNMPGLCNELIVVGHSIQGGFAQHMVIPGIAVEKGQLIKIPDGLEAENMILVELLASVIKSQERLEVSLGETVVIIGAGPIGCLHSQIASIRGATTIIMADLNNNRLNMVKKFGGTHFVDTSKNDLVKIVQALTKGIGADVVIVAAPSTQPHQPGLEMLRKEGRLSIFGGLNKDNPWSNLDANLIHYNRLKIIGDYSYSKATFELGCKLIEAGKIDTGIITHKIKLKNIEEGIKLIQEGKAIKVVLLPNKE